nr:hypothetical protein [uncultured Campylobacter sp.]
MSLEAAKFKIYALFRYGKIPRLLPQSRILNFTLCHKFKFYRPHQNIAPASFAASVSRSRYGYLQARLDCKISSIKLFIKFRRFCFGDKISHRNSARKFLIQNFCVKFCLKIYPQNFKRLNSAHKFTL